MAPGDGTVSALSFAAMQPLRQKCPLQSSSLLNRGANARDPHIKTSASGWSLASRSQKCSEPSR